jgi:protein associated with RNAse G/E
MITMMKSTYVHAFKPDGSSHQPWDAELIAQTREWLVIHSPYGTRVEHHTKHLSYVMRHRNLEVFSTREYYNVFIDFAADGESKMLYINVATPAAVRDDELSWRDLCLDVVRLPGRPAELVDQDEFEEAKVTGALTDELAIKAEATARYLMEVVPTGQFPFLVTDYDKAVRLLSDLR